MVYFSAQGLSVRFEDSRLVSSRAEDLLCWRLGNLIMAPCWVKSPVASYGIVITTEAKL